MPSWSDYSAIRREVNRKWDTGQILRNAFEDEGLFPLRLKLKVPSTEEMNTHFAEMLDWTRRLRKGVGFVLEERERHNRVSGKNMVPEYAVILTLEDAVQMLGKQSELRLFQKNSSALLQEWECLHVWIKRHPFQVVTIGNDIYAVLQVLRWFAQHESRSLYLRQLDIEGVDTKYIETHKKLFIQLLDLILPQDQINHGASGFEARYELKTKPHLIRFRILDDALAPRGCTDISLPIEQFAQLQVPFTRIFIVENEINFLSLPSVSNACVIFGAGYRIESFKNIEWLRDKEVFYWGDIDTHGLNILGMVRAFLPQVKSFLMNEDTLLSHRSLWSEETTPFAGEFLHLTPSEHALACRLQGNRWGVGVRLEQERIRFSEVEKFVVACGNLEEI